MTIKQRLQQFYEWDTRYDHSAPWIARVRWITLGVAMALVLHWLRV